MVSSKRKVERILREMQDERDGKDLLETHGPLCTKNTLAILSVGNFIYRDDAEVAPQGVRLKRNEINPGPHHTAHENTQ